MDLTFREPVYLTAQIRQLEQAAVQADPDCRLMERAGLATAELARELLEDGQARVLVLAGPGNNGGDGFVAARHLRAWWYRVSVVFPGDPAKLPHDAADAYRKFREAGGETIPDLPEKECWDLAIDGLFGIGLARDIAGGYQALMERVNALALPLLAIDIPSGLDSDTGRVRGCALRARHTLTFIALKPGLLTLDGTDLCGRVRVASLGLDAPRLLAPQGWRLDESVARFLRPRRANSHKGTYGSVGILGGAPGMVGAAMLAGRAALKLGTGRVYVGALAEDRPSLDPQQPELMWRTPWELLQLDHLSCVAAGPGLGLSDQAAGLLESALASPLPLVLDADALNLIGATPGLQRYLGTRQAPCILTPHPAEAARLLGTDTATIQQDRVAAALQLASRFHACVVLKGAGSVCALPDGRWYINPTGNPGMASAGMGDVLTGILAALLAQGLTPEQALLLAVYLHGAAADECVDRGMGPVGLTASDVTDAARRLVNRWVYAKVKGEG